jgi:hypothetical protein
MRLSMYILSRKIDKSFSDTWGLKLLCQKACCATTERSGDRGAANPGLTRINHLFYRQKQKQNRDKQLTFIVRAIVRNAILISSPDQSKLLPESHLENLIRRCLNRINFYTCFFLNQFFQ